jgi:hypothetical protein
VRSQAPTRFRPAVLILHPIDAFETYGERNFNYMKHGVETVRDSCRHVLPKPYDGKVGVFPCRSFNVGGQAITAPHVDEKNLAHSWCAITALGRFNPSIGGHLILWDFGLAVKFPPGSTILIPSALLVHSNASIRPDETRAAIVQYAAGGLFRWSELLMTEKQFLEQATDEDLQRYQNRQASHWVEAVGMFTGLEELMGSESGSQNTGDNINIINIA